MVHLIRFGLAGGLLLIICFARRSTGTWANPVSFYAGPFMLIALAQEALLPALPFDELMAGLIIGTTIVLFLGMLVTWRRPEVIVDPRPLSRGRPVLRTVALCGSFAVALFYLYQLYEIRRTGLGMGANGIFYRAEFYAQGGDTLFLRALQALTYCGALCVAFEARLRKRPVLLIGAYLLIVLLQGVVVSAKQPVLLVTLLVIGAVAAGHPTKFQRINLRVVAGAVGVLLVLLLTFQIVTSLRSKGTADVAAVTGYAILGSPSAYSLVLEGRATIALDPRWGMSVAGVRDAVVGEGDTRQLGMFDGSVRLDPYRYESRVNLFTWFVPLRHDFGLPGTFAVIFALGLLGGALTTRQITGALGVLGQTMLAMLNLGLMFAPMTTLTYYNFTFLLLALGIVLALLYTRSDQDVRAESFKVNVQASANLMPGIAGDCTTIKREAVPRAGSG